MNIENDVMTVINTIEHDPFFLPNFEPCFMELNKLKNVKFKYIGHKYIEHIKSVSTIYQFTITNIKYSQFCKINISMHYRGDFGELTFNEQKKQYFYSHFSFDEPVFKNAIHCQCCNSYFQRINNHKKNNSHIEKEKTYNFFIDKLNEDTAKYIYSFLPIQTYIK